MVGRTLFCSGQIAIDPQTARLISGTIAEETERTLENLGSILRAAGMTYADVVRCSVYLTDMNNYAQVNEVYAQYFDDAPPTRTAAEVAALPRGANVEISCVAIR